MYGDAGVFRLSVQRSFAFKMFALPSSFFFILARLRVGTAPCHFFVIAVREPRNTIWCPLASFTRVKRKVRKSGQVKLMLRDRMVKPWNHITTNKSYGTDCFEKSRSVQNIYFWRIFLFCLSKAIKVPFCGIAAQYITNETREKLKSVSI